MNIQKNFITIEVVDKLKIKQALKNIVYLFIF